MSKKREFGESWLFTLSNIIWWLLLSSFYFWLMNLPLVLIGGAMLIAGSFEMNWLLGLSLLFVAPSFTALLSVMGKLTRVHDLNTTRDFFKAYRQNLMDALFLGAVELVVMTLLWVDILYIRAGHGFGALQLAPKLLMLIIVGMNFYVFPILSRFHLRKGQLLLLSLKSMIRRPLPLVTAYSALYLVLNLLLKFNPPLVILLSPVLITYPVMFLERGMLEQIEQRFEKQQQNSK